MPLEYNSIMSKLKKRIRNIFFRKNLAHLVTQKGKNRRINDQRDLMSVQVYQAQPTAKQVKALNSNSQIYVKCMTNIN